MTKNSGRYVMLAGFILMLAAVNMKTTVPFEGVYWLNFGLLVDRSERITIASVVLLCGVLISLLGRDDLKKKKSQSIDLYDGDRNILDRKYQLFLINFFTISKNNTLDKFVIEGDVFDTLDEALEEANSRYGLAIIEDERKNKKANLRREKFEKNKEEFAKDISRQKSEIVEDSRIIATYITTKVKPKYVIIAVFSVMFLVATIDFFVNN